MLENIKLIIWDLDETLWKGTLSEEKVSLQDETKDFLKRTLDAGIIHSICSKNDFDAARKALEAFGIWDCFVFPSIDWSPKGQRIQKLIETMQLRPAHVICSCDEYIQKHLERMKDAENVYWDVSRLEMSSEERLLFNKKIDGKIIYMKNSDQDEVKYSQYQDIGEGE